jgi:hypothetical protein
LPILDPGTAADVFSVIKELERPGLVELNLNAASTIFSVIGKESGGN